MMEMLVSPRTCSNLNVNKTSNPILTLCTQAHADSDQWVNYFMHAGHLHIEGSKMSKSLKNFITIKDALDTYTAKQIRIMFLLHQWDKVLDYKEESMREAISWETSMNVRSISSF